MAACLHSEEELSRFSSGTAVANDEDFASLISRSMDKNESLYVRGLSMSAMGVQMNDMSEFMVKSKKTI